MLAVHDILQLASVVSITGLKKKGLTYSVCVCLTVFICIRNVYGLFFSGISSKKLWEMVKFDIYLARVAYNINDISFYAQW